MLFDIESFDYSYYDEGSEGLKLALVHHLDMPIMRQKGFHIAPGNVYLFCYLGLTFITNLRLLRKAKYSDYTPHFNLINLFNPNIPGGGRLD